jgi:putative membrane protein
MIINRRIPVGFILNNIKISAITILIILFTVWALNFFFIFPEIPVSIPAFLGTSIALVLGFKLSQSYDRWWEARKIWGAIVNDSRSLVLQVKHFAADEKILKDVALRQIAWCYCLGQSLRKLNPHEHLENYISSEELEAIKKHKNVPLAILDLHSRDAKTLFSSKKVDSYQYMQVDQTIVRLTESMGKAERIKNTVFPTTYRLFLHFFIFLFIFLLAISLISRGGGSQIPILFFISLPFILLEMTATLLQDPFENKPTDVSVTALARTIEINLKQLIGMTDIPEALPSKSYYVN